MAWASHLVCLAIGVLFGIELSGAGETTISTDGSVHVWQHARRDRRRLMELVVRYTGGATPNVTSRQEELELEPARAAKPLVIPPTHAHAQPQRL